MKNMGPTQKEMNRSLRCASWFAFTCCTCSHTGHVKLIARGIQRCQSHAP